MLSAAAFEKGSHHYCRDAQDTVCALLAVLEEDDNHNNHVLWRKSQQKAQQSTVNVIQPKKKNYLFHTCFLQYFKYGSCAETEQYKVKCSCKPQQSLGHLALELMEHGCKILEGASRLDTLTFVYPIPM